MKRKTHRTETRVETHEVKIIRFGKRVEGESDDTETATPLIAEHSTGKEDDERRDWDE